MFTPSLPGSPCHHLWHNPSLSLSLPPPPSPPSFPVLSPCISLCIPPSGPFSALSSSFSSPVTHFSSLPLILAFHPLAVFSLCLSLSFHLRPTPVSPLFLLVSYSPLFLISLLFLGRFLPAPHPQPPACRPPHLCPFPPPPRTCPAIGGVTYQAVGSQGRRPDGSGSVGRRGCGRCRHRRGPGPASSLEVGTVWGPQLRGAQGLLGTGQGEGTAE